MAHGQPDAARPGVLEHGQRPGTMERERGARNPGSQQQERLQAQRRAAEDWRLLDCMDESGIEAAGVKPLQPELERIGALTSKKEITLEIASLHHLFPGAWEQSDNQTNSPFFGFTGQQDYDDASKVVAQIDQGGLSLPGRDYYIKTDEKSVETLKKYGAHLRKMFVLAGH